MLTACHERLLLIPSCQYRSHTYHSAADPSLLCAVGHGRSWPDATWSQVYNSHLREANVPNRQGMECGDVLRQARLAHSVSESALRSCVKLLCVHGLGHGDVLTPTVVSRDGTL